MVLRARYAPARVQLACSQCFFPGLQLPKGSSYATSCGDTRCSKVVGVAKVVSQSRLSCGMCCFGGRLVAARGVRCSVPFAIGKPNHRCSLVDVLGMGLRCDSEQGGCSVCFLFPDMFEVEERRKEARSDGVFLKRAYRSGYV